MFLIKHQWVYLAYAEERQMTACVPVPAQTSQMTNLDSYFSILAYLLYQKQFCLYPVVSPHSWPLKSHHLVQLNVWNNCKEFCLWHVSDSESTKGKTVFCEVTLPPWLSTFNHQNLPVNPGESLWWFWRGPARVWYWIYESGPDIRTTWKK